MPRLSETIARLAAMKLPPSAVAGRDRLVDAPAPARNPGALQARAYLPADLARGAPLVVVLHGCTQTAAGYDAGSGWSTLADQAGFALLFPEQTRRNNANLCFNWFERADIARAGGEAESIAALTEAMIAAHGLDRARVFVTGLSAGGAMANAMLATYPDVFAGGAIIGGLPYDCASGVGQAMERMRGQGLSADPAALRRAVAGHGARRPSVSLWHGTQDTTVVPANMAAAGRQWRGVHGLPDAPSATEHGATWEHRRWTDADGRTLVEEWSVTGMGHGVPLDPAAGLGAAGPYMLDVALDSTRAIAAGWGLIAAAPAASTPEPRYRPMTREPLPAEPASAPMGSAQEVIERTLRSVGLIR
jgi:poly(hydroxyalkanoate) depolymerase family esterase